MSRRENHGKNETGNKNENSLISKVRSESLIINPSIQVKTQKVKTDSTSQIRTALLETATGLIQQKEWQKAINIYANYIKIYRKGKNQATRSWVKILSKTISLAVVSWPDLFL